MSCRFAFACWHHAACVLSGFQNSTAKPATQSWESVAFIPVVSSVEVDLTTGETINGRFRSADERELVLEQDGLLRQVPRAEIRRVILYKGRHAGRGALWGLGIGTGIGIAVDAATGPGYDFGERFLFTLIFVGLGSGIGALFGTLVRERGCNLRGTLILRNTGDSEALRRV